MIINRGTRGGIIIGKDDGNFDQNCAFCTSSCSWNAVYIQQADGSIAWYGHLKFKEMSWSRNLGLISLILISWGIALFEYMLQVPANRAGFKEMGGPFSLVQLKVIQEVITLCVFVVFSLLFFKKRSRVDRFLQWERVTNPLIYNQYIYMHMTKIVPIPTAATANGPTKYHENNKIIITINDMIPTPI